jgi:hypothetical protein
MNHYGHFIDSTLARIWALAEVDITTVPLLGRAAGTPSDWFNWRPSVPTLIGAAGITYADFTYFDQPVRIKELVIAQPSFVVKNRSHQNHAEAWQQIGDRLVKGSPMAEQRDWCIFLRRSIPATELSLQMRTKLRGKWRRSACQCIARDLIFRRVNQTVSKHLQNNWSDRVRFSTQAFSIRPRVSKPT